MKDIAKPCSRLNWYVRTSFFIFLSFFSLFSFFLFSFFPFFLFFFFSFFLFFFFFSFSLSLFLCVFVSAIVIAMPLPGCRVAHGCLSVL